MKIQPIREITVAIFILLRDIIMYAWWAHLELETHLPSKINTRSKQHPATRNL